MTKNYLKDHQGACRCEQHFRSGPTRSVASAPSPVAPRGSSRCIATRARAACFRGARLRDVASGIPRGTMLIRWVTIGKAYLNWDILIAMSTDIVVKKWMQIEIFGNRFEEFPERELAKLID